MAKFKGTAGSDIILGTSLIDEITGGAGNDWIDGQAGADFIDGNSGDDQLIGGADNDVLLGNLGNDFISDGDGDDYVNAGTGDDVVLAGAGNDTFIGGQGFDTIDFSSATASVRVDLSKGTAVGPDQDVVRGFESVVGTRFSDNLRGSSTADSLSGGDGNDRIRGAAGDDTLTGGNGADTFQYKSADIFGALGDQHFVDRITDFTTSDRIDLREVLGNIGYDTSADVVRLVEDGVGNSTLEVNVGAGFRAVAVLENFSIGADVPVTALTSDGVILV